jgi:Fe2+ transport system protein FeoA
MEGEYFPLTIAIPGQEVTLFAINGGKGIKSRLISLGLTPGVKIKVLNNGPGPLIISVRDSRLALGYGMANKIMVK